MQMLHIKFFPKKKILFVKNYLLSMMIFKHLSSVNLFDNLFIKSNLFCLIDSGEYSIIFITLLYSCKGLNV